MANFGLIINVEHYLVERKFTFCVFELAENFKEILSKEAGRGTLAIVIE